VSIIFADSLRPKAVNGGSWIVWSRGMVLCVASAWRTRWICGRILRWLWRELAIDTAGLDELILKRVGVANQE
jgi:hypothetical protein